MILCCILLVPGCSAGLSGAINSSAMDPESANTLISRLCAAGLDVTAPTARDCGHPCGHGHDHHNNDVCLGRRDYLLGSNVSSGFAQVNSRPGAPPPEKELLGAARGLPRVRLHRLASDGARSCGRAPQATPTIEHEGFYPLLSPGQRRDRDKPLAIIIACGSDHS